MHIGVRYAVQSAQGTLMKIAANAGRTDLGSKVFAGFGDVHDTHLADDLWRISRDELTVDEFVREYGYHGPNEGNVYTTSWREKPSRVQALADAYRNRENVMRPRLREEAAIVAGLAAQQELLAAVSPLRRPVLRRLLAHTSSVVRNVQLARLAYLMCLDGTRAAARALVAEAVATGQVDEQDDAFFLTVSELRRLAAGVLADPKATVGARRAQRAKYTLVQIPESLTGMPEPYRLADVDCTPSDSGGTVAPVVASSTPLITAIGASGGTVQGRATVALDPYDEVDFQDGGVLVCRNTDPSWMPLIGVADALVVDVGSSASHGAIVAREFGIPCVVGTANGTAVIHSGDLIAVDGDAGTVTLLERGAPADRR